MRSDGAGSPPHTVSAAAPQKTGCDFNNNEDGEVRIVLE